MKDMTTRPHHEPDESRAVAQRDAPAFSWPGAALENGPMSGPSASGACADYVLHCFDDIGRSLSDEPIKAEDDDVAIAIARLHLHMRCEIWKGNRMVLAVTEGRVQEFAGSGSVAVASSI